MYELTAEEKKFLLCMRWLSNNRPHLEPYLNQASVLTSDVANEQDLLSIAVNGPNGYEYFTFTVDLETKTVTLDSADT